MPDIASYPGGVPPIGARLIGDDGVQTVAPNLFGIRGVKHLGTMPLSVMSGAPTITTVTSDTTTVPNPVLMARNGGPFRYPSAPVTTQSTSYYIPGYGATIKNLWPWVVEFWSDAPKLALRIQDLGGAAYYVHISVDGELAHAAPVSAGGLGSTVPNLIELDWRGVSKPRLYRIALKATSFGGVYVGAADSVWYPTERRRPTLCTFGDSYGDTYPTTGPGALASLFAQIAWALDFEHLNMNYFGTGYTVGGTGAVPNIVQDRLGNLLAQGGATPDAILFAGGFNDRAQSQATISANAATAYTTARTLAPKAKILVLGPWTPQGEAADANLATTRNTLLAAATAAGLTFLDIAQIITAANKSRYMRADNVHPTDAEGHRFLASRIGPMIHQALAA